MHHKYKNEKATCNYFLNYYIHLQYSKWAEKCHCIIFNAVLEMSGIFTLKNTLKCQKNLFIQSQFAVAHFSTCSHLYFFFLNKKNVKSTVCLLLGWWKSANIRSQWKTDSVFYLQWVRFHRSHRLLQKWIQLDIMQATVTQVARILIRFHNHFTWILKHFEHYIVQESTKRWKLFPLLSKSMTNLWSYNT